MSPPVVLPPAVATEPERLERNPPYHPTPDNRPVALDHGVLALTLDPRSQMSFGERAALEGILSELSPRLALEIGTAEGGNLRRIATHAQHVHSIDLDHAPVGTDLPSNVELHTGDSAELLPGLLARIAQAGQTIDLALVDGDHSHDGVRRDLELLLDSPCTERTVILVHDTMNPEVRAGVESGAFHERPAVVYVELDFVPGYVYRRGAARGTAWGGLGLILTDTERSAAYRDSPRQGLYHEPFAALQRMRSQS